MFLSLQFYGTLLFAIIWSPSLIAPSLAYSCSNNGDCYYSGSAGGTFTCDFNNGNCFCGNAGSCTCSFNNGNCNCESSQYCFCNGNNGDCCYKPQYTNSTVNNGARDNEVTSSGQCPAEFSSAAAAALISVFSFLVFCGVCLCIFFRCCCSQRRATVNAAPATSQGFSKLQDAPIPVARPVAVVAPAYTTTAQASYGGQVEGYSNTGGYPGSTLISPVPLQQPQQQQTQYRPQYAEAGQVQWNQPGYIQNGQQETFYTAAGEVHAAPPAFNPNM